ncbi:MAG: hypothetical protein D6698_03435 [Gammaproteobacteria bacterium]|nr:MAG: hypothetical protein D6698_03435 [Gammaproteobacteria bacterium]
MEFTLDDRYEMELIADECLSFLLYWQFDFDMAIKDKNTGKKYHYHFVSPDGPSLKFLLSGRHPENILITGTGHSQGQAWLIDLQVDTIQFLKFNEAIQDSTYKTIAEFNDSFELVMKK